MDSLKDLIARLEQGISAAAKAARNAARLAEEPKPGERPDLAAFKDPGRLEPAVAFASLKGHLQMPVKRRQNHVILARRTAWEAPKKASR